MYIKTLALIISLVTVFLISCGVKGPPLPPIPITPQRSDVEPRPAPSTEAVTPEKEISE